MKSVLTLTRLLGLLGLARVSAEPLIEGRVRLDSGEPVADAQVRLFDLTDLGREAVARATTDGTGYFALPLAALAGSALPEGFALGPNYPNPFNPSTIIPYQLATASQVRLEVFNLLGQRIATLVDGERPAGFHTATWHATDVAGQAVGSGVYIYRMTVGAASQTGRMVLIDGQAGVSAVGAASVWSGVSSGDGSTGGDAQVYGLIVSGEGLVPYVDSSFQVEAGMVPVELVVSSVHSGGKVTDDDCAFCDLFDALNDGEEEEEARPSGKAQAILEAPAAPTNLRFDAPTDSSCTVRWDAAEGATDYDVNYKPAVGGQWTNEPHRGIRLSNTIHDLEPGTEYRWAVRSENGEGSSAWVFGPNFTTLEEETTETTEEEEDEATEEEEDDEREEEAAETDSTSSSGSDLIIQVSSKSDSPLTPGQFFSLVVLVRNQGDGQAAATTLTYYRSTDTTISVSDTKVGTDAVDALAAGFSLKSIRLTAPSSEGTYYYGACVASVAGESNTDNNCSSSMAVTVRSGSSPVTIPDAKLRAAIAAELGKASGATIYKSELETLTRLDLGRGSEAGTAYISGLTGLEFATNLSSLKLRNNNITDISPLSGLTNLESLDFTANNITDISPLSSLTNLESLDFTANNITDISPLLGSKFWTWWLDLRENPLSVSSINDHIPVLQARFMEGHIGRSLLFGPPLRESDFDIELVFLDRFSFSDGQKRIFRHAARRWMSIIREDLPDYKFTRGWSSTSCGDQSYEIPSGERIDDLRIYVGSVERTGEITIHIANRETTYEPAAFASLHLNRKTLLPLVGCVTNNLKFKRKSSSSSSGTLGVWLHEIGHILGIGMAVMYQSDFLQDSSDDPHFNGPRAIAAFDDAGGRDYTGAKVPVEKSGGHWRAPMLNGELMSVGSRLSAVTIQALADLGYVVDVTQADPYTLFSTAARASAKIAAPSTMEPEFSCGVGQQQEPTYVVDPQGNIIRTLHR